MTAALPISAIYVTAAALMVVALLLRVAWLRNTLRVGMGDGDKPALARAIRTHANAVECLPLALLLLVMLEISGETGAWLHGLGVALIAARLVHAFGLLRRSNYSFGRFFGTVATIAVILAMCGELLWINRGV